MRCDIDRLREEKRGNENAVIKGFHNSLLLSCYLGSAPMIQRLRYTNPKQQPMTL